MSRYNHPSGANAMSRNSRESRIGAQRMEDTLESENNRLQEQLRAQTAALKDVAISIDDELQHHKSLLNSLQDDMLGADTMLGQTMNRLGQVTGLGSSKIMCYLIGFCVFVFILLWYLVR